MGPVVVASWCTLRRRWPNVTLLGLFVGLVGGSAWRRPPWAPIEELTGPRLWKLTAGRDQPGEDLIIGSRPVSLSDPPGMVEHVFESMVDEMKGALAGFDPASVPLGSTEAGWLRLDQIERLASGAKLRLAARVEESGSWRRAGRRSAADHLSLLSGSTVGAARGQLETSRQLPSLPVVEDAVRAGTLDHTAPWASRITLLQTLQPLCAHHHRRKARNDLTAIRAQHDQTGPAG